jgi:hypothetical protein
MQNITAHFLYVIFITADFVFKMFFFRMLTTFFHSISIGTSKSNPSHAAAGVLAFIFQ